MSLRIEIQFRKLTGCVGISIGLMLATIPVDSRAEDAGLNGVTDLSGHPVDRLESRDRKVLVLVFMSIDCPISNRYAPELRSLQSDFKEARFVLVYPNRDESADAIQKSLKEYHLPFEAWRDPNHAVVKAAGVQVTPEAAVLLPSKGWIYRGRIDDRYVDWGKKRAEAMKHDLREVLAELSKGTVLRLRTTKAVGCHITRSNE